MESMFRDMPRRQVIQSYIQGVEGVDISGVETFLYFLQIANEYFLALQTHFTRYDLSDGKFTILMLLLRASDQSLSPSELAEQSGVTRSTITGLLDGLQQIGLVARRQRSGDRRMLKIELTSAGKALLDKMLPDHFARIGRVMTSLDAGQRAEFRNLLLNLHQKIDALREEN